MTEVRCACRKLQSLLGPEHCKQTGNFVMVYQLWRTTVKFNALHPQAPCFKTTRGLRTGNQMHEVHGHRLWYTPADLTPCLTDSQEQTVERNTGHFWGFWGLYLEQPAAVCPFSQFSCYLQETSQDASLWLDLSPINTGAPNGPLMLPKCFFDFVFEHQFGCRTAEPGFAADIGDIEIWLFNWLRR